MVGGLPANLTVYGFAVNPVDPRVMYVAMRDGLLKSGDAGKSWSSIGKDLKNLAAVAVNPKRPDEVYAATDEGVVFKSTDGGTTWERQQ